jgi:hypothetical protein
VPLGFVDPALEERRRGSAAASLTQSGAARVLDRLSTLEELLP